MKYNKQGEPQDTEIHFHDLQVSLYSHIWNSLNSTEYLFSAH